MNNDKKFNYFTPEIEKELLYYRKYLKYSRNNKINIGNRNILILDSSHKKYNKILDEIYKYNNCSKYNVKLYIDTEYISSKYGFDENSILNEISKNDRNEFCEFTSIFVVGNISKENALSRYGKYFTFFINLDEDVELEDKSSIIKKMCYDNNFLISNDNALHHLENLQENEIERELTRAFICALNDNSTTIKEKYLTKNENVLKSNLKLLNDMIRIGQYQRNNKRNNKLFSYFAKT